MEVNELSKNARGGTELMMERLHSSFPADLLDKFQIIPSRVRDLNPDKIRILYCHDLPDDPESKHLANNGWNKFHKIVFVSHWQQQRYIERYNIPWPLTAVLLNAIDPIKFTEQDKTSDKINLIYHTTPHRGLELLYPVFEKVAAEHADVHLDVFSSFKIYGWETRDEPYKPLFEKLDAHPQITYHGYQPNDSVRAYLQKAHIFAYPSIWPETSCIALMEAMSAGLICVHPNLAALPETAANWTLQYNWDPDPNTHATTFYMMLSNAISFHRDRAKNMIGTRLMSQKGYADMFYGWEMRKMMWAALFNQLKDIDPTKKVFQEEWVYRS